MLADEGVREASLPVPHAAAKKSAEQEAAYATLLQLDHKEKS